MCSTLIEKKKSKRGDGSCLKDARAGGKDQLCMKKKAEKQSGLVRRTDRSCCLRAMTKDVTGLPVCFLGSLVMILWWELLDRLREIYRSVLG